MASFRLAIAALVGVLGSATLVTVSSVATPTSAGASGCTPSAFPAIYRFVDASTQQWCAPATKRIAVLVVGAAGGSDFFPAGSPTGTATVLGGYGAAELGTIDVNAGDDLTLTVGNVGGNSPQEEPGAGGYGGGAGAGSAGASFIAGGAGGGGASSVFLGSSPEVVAGGGGGAGGTGCVNQGLGCMSPLLGGNGGAGGGSEGGTGGYGTSKLGPPLVPGAAGGTGGTTSGSGGSPGTGGAANAGCHNGADASGSAGSGVGGVGGNGCYIFSGGGGGGGGGYFAGGGGGGGGDLPGDNSAGGGGGGGSSFASSSGATSENGANVGYGYVEIGPVGSLQLPPIGGPVSAANAAGGGASDVCSCVPAPVGAPVNTMDGDFYESTTDLSVPGPGVPLAFTRTYDSYLAQTSNGVDNGSGLGPGWTDNLAMHVASVPGLATVTEEDGAQVQFSTTNTANPWCSSTYNYCPVAPRDISTLEYNSGGAADTWTFTNHIGPALTYDFSAAGALTSITNAAGQSITASSETPGSGTCPSSTGVTACTLWTSNASSSNTTLTEVFSSAELSEVIGFAPSGTAPNATFCYYGTSCTSATTGLSGSLYSVTDPGVGATTYTYDSTDSSPQLRYDVLDRTNPDGTSQANTYDATTSSATFGSVTQQVDSSGVSRSFSYSETTGSPPGDGPADSTTVSLSPGTGLPTQVTQYNYDFGVLTSTVMDPGASASTTATIRSPITIQTTSSTDPNGNTTTTNLSTPSGPSSYLNAVDPTSQVDAAGNITLYAYTSSNQVWCEVEPAEVANGVVCPSTQPASPPAAGAARPTADCTTSSSMSCLGATITYYDTHDNPVAVTDPLGNTNITAYTGTGDGVPIELPYCTVDATEYTDHSVSCPSYGSSAAGAATTVYDAAGRKSSSTSATGATTSYSYGDSSFPDTATSIADPQGDITTIALDAAGRPTTSSEENPASTFSATTQTAYDSSGRVFCTVAPLAYAQGDRCPSTAPTSAPSAGSDPYPGAQVTIYNGTAQPTYQINPLGGVTESAYDGAGNVYCSVSPANYTAGKTCPAPGASWVGGTTVTDYDAFGRPTQVTNALGGITLTSYDAAGNVTETTVESNNATADVDVVTTYGYDADNRVTSTTVDPQPGGASPQQKSEQAYDPDSNVYCSVSAKAVAAADFQCAPWQASWISAPPSPTSLYSSTPSSSQANDVSTAFYDANGNEVQSTDPDVQTTVNAFDPDGRTYCSVDPTNVASWLSADPTGTYPYRCPASPPSTAPTGTPKDTTTIYDAAGNVVSSTDQVDDTTSHTYDDAGDLLTTTDPRGKVTTDCYYGESATGECAHGVATSGGLAASLYSTATPATSADPSGELTSYTYAPGGLGLATTTPAGTTTDAYDANGDLGSVTFSGTASGYSAATNLSYTYNQDGTRQTMSDATGTTTYGYDANGDVTAKDLAASGSLSSTSTSYGYFTNGVLASITYPSYGTYSSPTVNYTYDATGAMATETDWLGNVVNFGHDANGNTTSQDNNVSSTNPNGTSSTAFSYDAADQNTAAASTINQSCGGAETLTQSFGGSSGSRNPDGQLTQEQTSYSASCSGQTTSQRNYSYDEAGRVTYQGSSSQGANPADFVYDASGDPTTISEHASSGGSFNTYNQSYDDAGEVSGQSPVSGSGGSTSSYTYDTLGDQTQASSGADTTSYAYNQAGQLASTATTNGSASYLHDGDGLSTAALTAGGVLWGPPADLNPAGAINALSCTSKTFCVAVGAGGNASIYDGTNWSVPTDVDGVHSLVALSCTSSSFCVAVDDNGHEVTYNGSSWSSPVDIDGSRSLTVLACTSSSFCVAADAGGDATTYTGSSWSTPTNVDGSRTVSALSCTSSSFCAAVDTAGHALTYNGTSWSATPSDIDGTNNIDALSCTSSSFCMAVDTVGNAMTYGGSSWSSAADVDATRSITALSCPSANQCVAVDNAGYALSYSMSAWSTPSDIDGSNGLKAISCMSAASCEATDAAGNVVTYNGTTWSSPTQVDASRSLDAISCPSSTFCAVADSSGFGVVYALVSNAWSSASDVDGSRAMNAVSCSSSTFCAAVDASGYATTFNGTAWSSPTDVDAARVLDAVSCVSSSFCVAVDTSGYAVVYNGSSWSSPTDVNGTRSLNAVVCTTSSFCMAVGNSGYAVSYNGSAWSSPSDIDASRNLTALSCTSSSFCVAVGTNGYGVVYTGTWASATDIDASRTIDTVSCASASFCEAAGAGGYAISFNGTSWASATAIDGSRTVQSVACPSSSVCAAVDAQGYVTNYNGSSWTSPNDIDAGHSLQGLSCPSTTFCEAADHAGNVTNFNGSSWYVVENVDAARSVSAIACPTSSFCAAVDGSGYAVTYQPETSVTSTQLTWDTNDSLSLMLSDGTNDYLYGPKATPVEQVSLATSTPTYLTYSSANDTWLSTNGAGNETGFWGYDAFGNLAFGTPTSSFGYSGQYTDATTSLVNDRARWFEPQTGGFTTRDPEFVQTDQAFTYAGDDPVNSSDPTGLFNCNGVPENKPIAHYSRGVEAYNLVCGHKDPGGFGIRHIQEDKTKGGWRHFGGVLSSEMINHIIPVTIKLGRPVKRTSVGVGYQLTWVAISPALPPETEPFDIRVAVNFQFGRVVTAYAPDADIVDRNPLNNCSWAGVDLCEGGSFQPQPYAHLTSYVGGQTNRQICPTEYLTASANVTYLPR